MQKGNQMKALSPSKRRKASPLLNWLKKHFGKQKEQSYSPKQQKEKEKEKKLEQKGEDEVEELEQEGEDKELDKGDGRG